MPAIDIPRERWPECLDTFSRQHRAWLTTVEPSVRGVEARPLRAVEPVRDRTRGVREDGVPVLEEQVRRDDDGALLVSPADRLKQEVRGVGVTGQISNLIDGENLRPGVGAQAALSTQLCHGSGCTSSWTGPPLLRRRGHTASSENLSTLPASLRDLPVVRSEPGVLLAV